MGGWLVGANKGVVGIGVAGPLEGLVLGPCLPLDYRGDSLSN